MPLREPLKWTGGIRESASGLIVELHTDEGIVGVGEAPGPTLPAIQTIIDREFAQFLVGQDPLRTDGSCTGSRSTRATGQGSPRTRSRASRWRCST